MRGAFSAFVQQARGGGGADLGPAFGPEGADSVTQLELLSAAEAELRRSFDAHMEFLTEASYSLSTRIVLVFTFCFCHSCLFFIKYPGLLYSRYYKKSLFFGCTHGSYQYTIINTYSVRVWYSFRSIYLCNCQLLGEPVVVSRRNCFAPRFPLACLPWTFFFFFFGFFGVW